MKIYRGWKVYANVAYKGGTTLYFYGESLPQIKRYIDRFMDR